MAAYLATQNGVNFSNGAGDPIITNAIKTAGKAEPEAIRDAIASGTTPGPSGEIKFNEKGQGYGFTVFLPRNENSKPVVEATAQIAKPN